MSDHEILTLAELEDGSVVYRNTSSAGSGMSFQNVGDLKPVVEVELTDDEYRGKKLPKRFLDRVKRKTPQEKGNTGGAANGDPTQP